VTGSVTVVCNCFLLSDGEGRRLQVERRSSWWGAPILKIEVHPVMWRSPVS
jgi:hypothetical protein